MCLAERLARVLERPARLLAELEGPHELQGGRGRGKSIGATRLGPAAESRAVAGDL